MWMEDKMLYKAFTAAIISRPPKFAILGFSGESNADAVVGERNPQEGDACFDA